jgi:hypothetical protein
MATTTYERMATELDKVFVEPIRQRSIFSIIMPKRVDVPKGKRRIDFDTVSEMGEAEVGFAFPNPDSLARDMVKITPTELKLLCVHKAYEIDRDAFDSFAASGKALGSEAQLSAFQRVKRLIDEMCLYGYKPDGSTYKIKGLIAAAINASNSAAGSDMGTFGNSLVNISTALADIAGHGVQDQNNNWGLNATQYYELVKAISSGVVEWDQVMKHLSPNPSQPPGRIYQDTLITAATGLISPVDVLGDYIDRPTMRDISNVVGYDSRVGEADSPIYGHVVSYMVPRIKQEACLYHFSSGI